MTSSLASLLQALRIKPTQSKVTAPHKSFPPNQNSNIVGLPSGLLEITLDEVSQHDMCHDCWIVIYDRVYDVTNFLNSHPGGLDVIMDHAGRDATLAFHGTGHSKDAIDEMRDYLIGELPPKQRIFRTPKGSSSVLSMGIPE